MIFSKKPTKNKKSTKKATQGAVEVPVQNAKPAKKRVKVTEIKPDIDTFAKIRVVGVGGSGGAAVNRMLKNEIRGVDFIAVNTDSQALRQSKATTKLHIGQSVTRGLGAGMDPILGQKATEESKEEIVQRLSGSDMVFITCGLGGGTGTGASPAIADIVKNEIGALTVAVVTKPFTFEGAQRQAIAEEGYKELVEKVDAIITIQNDRLLQIIDKKTSLLDAFGTADAVLKQGVQGISELITLPGLINVDFADVKSIMKDAGSALMGIGEATGETRAHEAAKAAIDSPLLELAIDGAKGVLFSVCGGPDLTMHEINEAAQIITKSSDHNAKIIFGAIIDERLGDEIKITVVATGFAGDESPSFSTFHEKEQNQTSSAFSTDQPKQKQEKSRDQGTDFHFSKKVKKEVSKKSDFKETDDELEIPAFIRKRMNQE